MVATHLEAVVHTTAFLVSHQLIIYLIQVICCHR